MPYHQLCRACTDARHGCAKCLEPSAGGGGKQPAGGPAAAAPAAAPAAAMSPFLRSMHAAPGERGVRRPVERSKARAAPPNNRAADRVEASFDEVCEQALGAGFLTAAEHDRLTDLLAAGDADERSLRERVQQNIRDGESAKAGA